MSGGGWTSMIFCFEGGTQTPVNALKIETKTMSGLFGDYVRTQVFPEGQRNPQRRGHCLSVMVEIDGKLCLTKNVSYHSSVEKN